MKKAYVRYTGTKPSPYLVANAKLLKSVNKQRTCVDIGCGNGRNSIWANKVGYTVLGIDKHGGQLSGSYLSIRKDLSHCEIPVYDQSVSLVLANYIFMFLDEAGQDHVVTEINRVTAKGCYVVAEFYPAKQSFALTQKEAEQLCTRIRGGLMYGGSAQYDVVKQTKDKFILRRTN